MKSMRLIAGILAALSLASANAQEKDVKQMVVAVCSNCHGMDGNAISPIFPKLAGQNKEYLLAQMKAFRDQSRKDPDAHAYMWGISRLLDDNMRVKLADYFSAQKPTRGTPGDAQLAAKGKIIYEHGIESKKVPACASCHGQNAEGNAIFPRLAGQHPQYLVKQIRVFHSDDRPNGGVMMKAVVQGLSEQESDEVAAYLQGL
jgi:cytochrome c553